MRSLLHDRTDFGETAAALEESGGSAFSSHRTLASYATSRYDTYPYSCEVHDA